MKLCLKNELKPLLSVIKLSQSSISPLRMSLLSLSCFPFFSSQRWKGVGGRQEAVSQRRGNVAGCSGGGRTVAFLFSPLHSGGLLAGSRPLARGREEQLTLNQVWSFGYFIFFF